MVLFFFLPQVFDRIHSSSNIFVSLFFEKQWVSEWVMHFYCTSRQSCQQQDKNKAMGFMLGCTSFLRRQELIQVKSMSCQWALCCQRRCLKKSWTRKKEAAWMHQEVSLSFSKSKSVTKNNSRHSTEEGTRLRFLFPWCLLNQEEEAVEKVLRYSVSSIRLLCAFSDDTNAVKLSPLVLVVVHPDRHGHQSFTFSWL